MSQVLSDQLACLFLLLLFVFDGNEWEKMTVMVHGDEIIVCTRFPSNTL